VSEASIFVSEPRHVVRERRAEESNIGVIPRGLCRASRTSVSEFRYYPAVSAAGAYIDLYYAVAVAETATLEEVLGWYDEKFGRLAQNRLHILKALQYFADAEADAWPQMFVDIDWRNLTSFFEKEVKRLSDV